MKFFKHLYIEATTGFKTWKIEGDYTEGDFLVYHQNTVAAGLRIKNDRKYIIK